MTVIAKESLIIARAEAGYTIKELSEKSDVPSATICRAENGKPLSVRSANKLCRTLNYSFTELFQITKK